MTTQAHVESAYCRWFATLTETCSEFVELIHELHPLDLMALHSMMVDIVVEKIGTEDAEKWLKENPHIMRDTHAHLTVATENWTEEPYEYQLMKEVFFDEAHANGEI